MSVIELMPFDYETASDSEWNCFIAIQQRLMNEIHPDDPSIDPVIQRQSIEVLSRDPQNNFRRFIAQKDTVVVGLLTLNLPNDNDSHVATVEVYVDPEQRKQGIGRYLLNQAAIYCDAQQLTLLQGESRTVAGNAFATTLGGTVGNRIQEKRLCMADVDWALVEDWAASGAHRNPDIHIETIAGLISEDEAELASYARLYTEIDNQQPYEELEGTEREFSADNMRFEDREHQRLGITLWTAIARTLDGTLCGLTEISHHPEWSGRAVQGSTGVKDGFRGRGLGKWLKAEMLCTIRDQCPDVTVICTTTANTNAPMHAINKRLGFRFYKQRIVFKLQVADLLATLQVS